MENGVQMERFDHIGLVVKDIDAGIEACSSQLGIGPWGEVYDGGEVWCVKGVVGPVVFELIQPKEGVPSLWADFLNAQGEGLHHICFRAADIDDTVDKTVAQGGEVYFKNAFDDNSYMAYVKTGESSNVVVELLRNDLPVVGEPGSPRHPFTQYRDSA